MKIDKFKKKLKKKWIELKIRRAKKIVLGAADFPPQKGWIATDIETLNLTDFKDFSKYWKLNSRSNFFAEHVWEHLTYEEGIIASKNCFDFLVNGGCLRIAVPDGLHPDKEYIDYVKPGGSGFGSDDHKILYTYKKLASMLEEAGFTTQLLEYWDEKGTFHFQQWSAERGLVERSKDYDSRNEGGKLEYTSIIIDAVKTK